ncbi:hypothetical protein ACIG56_07260 [Nocardia fusca]|uniref:hypothetical protein n=1 Tax=Nocardia fusca TaxID=941183 RepID=UPI0037C9DE5A
MRFRRLRSIGKSGICSTGTHSTRVDPQDIYLAHGADLTATGPDINEAEMIRWVALDEAVRMIDRGEIVGAASVVGVYRALPEDRGLVGRAHARIGGPSFTEWLDATYPVKG